MLASPVRLARRASSLWTIAALASAVGAAALFLTATTYQINATRPQGEGELFVQEVTVAHRMLTEARQEGQPLAQSVRRVRNALDIEAVGVVSDAGVYLASTSPNLVGEPLRPPFLRVMLEQKRFGAVTGTLEQPVLIDGVEEWGPDDSLYHVLQPLEEGGALILSYDVSQLLHRRAAQAGIRPLTVQLGGAGALLIVVGILILVARAGARRRLAEASREADRIEARSRELERYNRELQEAREQAERALALAEETNQIRSEFVLMINHELRTPLTSVVTGAELLAEAEVLHTEDRGQILSDMVRDGRRLQELISQMLTVARIENRGLGYTLRDVSLGEVMERLEDLGSDRLLRRGDLAGQGPQSHQVSLRTDPEPLAQLILSLTDNALTHGAGQVTLTVTEELPFVPMLVVGRIPSSAVFFSVSDDGPGIDPHFLPRAFEKFEKQGRSSGTGLGLYLARLMVEAIEGAIAITTGAGGTTMTVAVPVARSRLREAVA